MQDQDLDQPRREVLLGMIQKEFKGYHPLISIARIAHSNDADLKLQFECHRTIAKYVEPELKSIEVKGGMEHRHKVHVSMFEEPIEGQFEQVEDGRKDLVVSGHRILPGGAVIDPDPVAVDEASRSW